MIRGDDSASSSGVGEDAAFERVERSMEIPPPPRESRAPVFKPRTLTSDAWFLEPSVSTFLFNLPSSSGSFWKHAALVSCSSPGRRRQSTGHDL